MLNVATNSIREAPPKPPHTQIQIRRNEPNFQTADHAVDSIVCALKTVVLLRPAEPNLNRISRSLNRISPRLNRNRRVLEQPISSGSPPALLASAWNSPARSNSPKPATPHPSVFPPDNPTRPTLHASSGTYFPRPDQSCSSRIPSKSRPPKRPRNQQREETFFLSSTKTSVVSNGSPTTQYMEDFPSHRLHVGVSLQMRDNASAQNSRSNRWDS